MALALANIKREPQAITVDTLSEKYCHGAGEKTEADVFARVAKAAAAVEKTPELRAKWAKLFEANMLAGAIGAGRIMASAGNDSNSTWINCFVEPVSDTAIGFDEHGVPGIYQALMEAGETLRCGGGVGYNFSAIRPRGAWVAGTKTEASGPCTFMDIFDTSCQSVAAAGNRRGAQMGMLNDHHPDIAEFITAKRTKGRWNNFNVSVGVSDEFMKAVIEDKPWELVHKAEPSPRLKSQGAFQRTDGAWVYRTMRARELWDTIMKSAYDFAEPGVIFLGNINRDNNLRYCEKIEATNPCAEEPLPPYGCCDLGPVILPRFVTGAFTEAAKFDMRTFDQAVKTLVRFLDNVLDATPWPLAQQKLEAQNKRRIGIGFTGLGDTLAMLGLHYGTQEARDWAANLAEQMCNAAYEASVDLAIEKGAFPLFDADKYLEEGTFASRLPQPLKDRIAKHGIRNSHLLSIAPTGTVSLAFADNASNGIEPPFDLAYVRNKRMADDSKQKFTVVDHAFRVFLETLPAKQATQILEDALAGRDVKQHLPKSFVTALELSCDEHLAMMGAVQPFIDTSISKTVNVAKDMPFDSFKELYLQAHRYGLKGCATYRPNDILGAVLESAAPPASAPVTEAKVKDVDPLRVSIERRPDGELASVSEKVTYWTQEGKKSLYLVVSFMNVEGVVDGKPVIVERPIEVFMPAGQSSEAQQWVSATMRAWSLTARDGRLPKVLADARKITWDKGPVRCGVYTKTDGTQLPRFHDSEVAALAYAVQQILHRRGFLDADGGPLPAGRIAVRGQQETLPGFAAPPVATVAASENRVMAGKKCSECGAHAVVKRDGCDHCTNCHAQGSCG